MKPMKTDEYKQAMSHHDAADERAKSAAQEMRRQPRVYIGADYKFLIVEIPKTLSIMSVGQAEEFCSELQRMIADAKKIHAFELAAKRCDKHGAYTTPRCPHCVQEQIEDEGMP